MTAIAADTTTVRPARHSRVLSVFRMHFANPNQMIWQPLAIYGFVFLANLAVWLIANVGDPTGLDEMDEGTRWSGATLFAFVWQLVIAVQAMNRTFPFALGLGASRRDFMLGTGLALVTMAAAWSVLIGALAAIEDATDGWFLRGHMFAAAYFGDDGPLLRIWYVLLIMLFFTGLGTVAGALYVRWRTWGMLAFGATLTVLLIGGLAAIALTNGWLAVGGFFVQLGFAGAYPLLLIPVAICAVLGWVALRRATARSAA